MNEDRTPQANAAAEWARLRERLRTVTPQTLARAVLTVVVGAGTIALVAASWPAALPFLIGAILAYELLPVVDALDRVMPRVLAAAVSVIAAVGIVIAILVLVLPPLALGFVRFATELPTSAEINSALADLQGRIGALPEGSATVILPALTTLATAVHDILSSASGGVDDLVRALIAALLNAVGALLGLIVLPTWMLTMMSQKHEARRVIDRRMAPWLRQDLWAVAGIADRAAGAYLRGYVIVAGLVGLLVYLGLTLAPRVGGPTFGQALTLAVLAGATQVIPVVGPLLGLVPALLILPIDPGRAGVYLAIYIAARLLGASMVGSRLMERRLGVHPAILVPAVVMIGQFGVLWLLLSAPIVAIAADLVRYFHGRLSEPPRPAGVLPRSIVKTAPARSEPRPVRSAYRAGVAPTPITAPAPPAAIPPTA